MAASPRDYTIEPREDANDQEWPPRVCDTCGGDGGFEVVDGPDHERGGAATHWSECRACDGSGEVPDDRVAFTFDDFDLTMEEALRLDEEKLIAMGAYD